MRPSEIRAISCIFNDHRAVEYNEKSCTTKYNFSFLDAEYFTQDALWDLREDCYEAILEHVEKDKSKFFERESERHKAFLEKIKSKVKDFGKWLTEPYGEVKKCFLDQLAIWDRKLACDLREKHAYSHNKELFNKIWLLDYLKTTTNLGEVQEMFMNYPQLKDPLRLELFRTILHSNDFPPMEKHFGEDWVHYQDSFGNTLLHHLFSEKLPKYDYFSKIAPVIVNMLDLEFNPRVKNNAGQSVIDLAKANGWDKFIKMLS